MCSRMVCCIPHCSYGCACMWCPAARAVSQCTAMYYFWWASTGASLIHCLRSGALLPRAGDQAYGPHNSSDLLAAGGAATAGSLEAANGWAPFNHKQVRGV